MYRCSMTYINNNSRVVKLKGIKKKAALNYKSSIDLACRCRFHGDGLDLVWSICGAHCERPS